MNKTTRGLLVFIGLVVFVGFFCVALPFAIMPGAGVGVALPVIFVPGEVLITDWLGEGFDLTNTLVGTALADVVILLIVLAIYAGGGIKMIPRRLQAMVELMVEYMYNFAKSVAGSKAGRIFPLVMSIFFFLLIANWLELVPGVDSVGLVHCAEANLAGYPLTEDGAPDEIQGVITLYNDTPLDAGTTATEVNYCACDAVHLGHFPYGETAECVVALAEAGVNVPADELHAAEAELAAHEGEVDTHTEDEDVATDEAGEAEADAAQEDAEHEGDGEGDHYGDLSEAMLAAIIAADEQFDAYQAALVAVDEAEADDAVSETELVALQAEAAALAVGAVDADLFVVTPFVRAAATDLNLTIALAIVSFLMIQVYGVWSLGPDYFSKFLNLRALGNLGQNPLGLIDFLVGLIEIVSEFAKIVSFAFRLFGNIFAGQVLLFITAFLVATIFPAIFYALELFVGLMQAFVFAVLTLIFSAQAMEGHHGDDDHH